MPNKEPVRQPSIRALRKRLAELERMSDYEREQLAKVTWVPPLQMFRELLNPCLRMKDRVERVIVYYKLAHGGDSPNWDQVGKLLNIHRVTASHYGKELLEDGRAKLVAGRFVLNNVYIDHPVMRQRVRVRTKRDKEVI